MDEDIIAIIAAFLIVFVPVAGLTARFALKPLIEAITEVLKVRQGSEEVRVLASRLALVEQELQNVRGEVREITEQKEFYRRLADPSEPRS